jgi:hypothetical protein
MNTTIMNTCIDNIYNRVDIDIAIYHMLMLDTKDVYYYSYYLSMKALDVSMKMS